jgi:hypothetical protein
MARFRSALILTGAGPLIGTFVINQTVIWGRVVDRNVATHVTWVMPAVQDASNRLASNRFRSAGQSCRCLGSKLDDDEASTFTAKSVSENV